MNRPARCDRPQGATLQAGPRSPDALNPSIMELLRDAHDHEGW
jgi:hypothetical protein